MRTTACSGTRACTSSTGRAISANLGVNPSLTSTAQAERAFALWPNRGEADARPALGAAYVPVPPVAPASPVVPPGAVGELRLPVSLGLPTVRATSTRA